MKPSTFRRIPSHTSISSKLRGNSMYDNNIQNDDLIQIIDTMIDKKLDNLSRTIDVNIKTIMNSVSNSLETHKQIDEDYRKKYDKLATKYAELKQREEDNFLRYNQTIATYQNMLVKLTCAIIQNNSNGEDLELLNSLSNKISDIDQKSSLSTARSRIQNPIISRPNLDKEQIKEFLSDDGL